jgi:hypothetical protein
VYPSVELAKHEPGFEENLQCFIDKYVELWKTSSSGTPILPFTYSAVEQRVHEQETTLMLDVIEKDLREYPPREPRQSAWRERIFARLRQFAIRVLQFPESHCDLIFSDAYLAATKAFVHQGRQFNSKMETEAIAQALRNVWVMNCLQLYLGIHPSLTPSVFAYSMLYPYTDNYLDRPNLSIRSKETACRRLKLRLAGESIDGCDAHETAVFRLLGMIEKEFPRDLFPEVHLSLLAIHEGQIRSLNQQRKSAELDEHHLLRVSVMKGGSSVLADGWLVGGRINPEEADFFFGFGVMLQLLDDLQDLHEDGQAGHRTLFTHTASMRPLDCITNRLWAFMHRILNSADSFTSPRRAELIDLIRRNSIMLMLRAMAECEDLFSREYLAHMERMSPLSFSFLRNRSREIRRRFEKAWFKLAKQRKLHSVFDLMGGSL